jgi:hypothetical protein
LLKIFIVALFFLLPLLNVTVTNTITLQKRRYKKYSFLATLDTILNVKVLGEVVRRHQNVQFLTTDGLCLNQDQVKN